MNEIPGSRGPGDIQGQEQAHPLSHPSHVREWLASFRKLDAGGQRRHLNALLREFRDEPQYARDVLDALTELERAWLPLATELQRSFRRNPAAVTDNPIQFHQEMSEISLSLGEIYRGFAQAVSAQSKLDGLPDVRLPQITALALFHFGKCVKFLYCKNEIPRGRLWKSLHGLYTLAADGGFAAERAALFSDGEVVATCTQLWLRTLMLATTSGAALTPRQFYRAEEWLQDWCTRITVDSAYDESLHVYCVDVTTARGPQRITAQLKLATPLYLGTMHLYRDISVARTRMVEDTMTSSLGLYAENPLQEYFELLDRLQRIWLSAPSMTSRRSSVRTAARTGERLEVVRRFEGILAATASPVENSAHIEAMPVMDHSDMGYGLLASGDESSVPRPRELIAVRSSSKQAWQIGVIVRATVSPSHRGYWLGVHMLAHTCIQVVLSKAPEISFAPAIPEFGYDKTAASPDSVSAFYLIGDASRNRPDSLLAPAGAYAPGDRLQLQTDVNAFLIRINRVIQSGEGWERSGFQVIEKTITKQ